MSFKDCVLDTKFRTIIRFARLIRKTKTLKEDLM